MAASGGTSLLLVLGLVIGLVASSSSPRLPNPLGTTAIPYVPAGDGSLQLVADVSRANPNATPQAVTRLAAQRRPSASTSCGSSWPPRPTRTCSSRRSVPTSTFPCSSSVRPDRRRSRSPRRSRPQACRPTPRLRRGTASARSCWRPRPPVSSDFANSLWVAGRLHVEAGFVEAAARSFGDDTYQTNFQTADATNAINAWIARETAGRIQRLLQPGQLEADTEVVLANAVHFHAAWAHKLFSAATVANEPFHLTAGGTVSVPSLVDSEDQFAFAVTHGYDAVQIPYSNGRYAALLVEPTGQSMASLLADISPGQLQSLTAGMQYGYLSLTMPELKLSSDTSLIAPLAKMGMAPAFVNADFSRMLGAFGASNQAVGVVQQAVTLNVNQWGTDAAAGTVVSVIPADAHSSTAIAFNHPYLFLIRDTKTGTLLFLSVVNNPAGA